MADPFGGLGIAPAPGPVVMHLPVGGPVPPAFFPDDDMAGQPDIAFCDYLLRPIATVCFPASGPLRESRFCRTASP